MPIYEYACRDDGFTFEFLVHGEREPVCPNCGGRNLEKKWSAFATKAPDEAPAACPMPTGPMGGGCCGGGCGLE